MVDVGAGMEVDAIAVTLLLPLAVTCASEPVPFKLPFKRTWPLLFTLLS